MLHVPCEAHVEQLLGDDPARTQHVKPGERQKHNQHDMITYGIIVDHYVLALDSRVFS